MSDSTPPTKIFLFGVSAKSQTSDQDSSGGQWGPALEAEPATPSPPAPEAAPTLGSAPLQPWLSRIAAPQGGRSTGMSCWEQPAGLGSAAAAVSQTQGLASARPARGSNHPATLPGLSIGNTTATLKYQTLTETASATGSGLQTQCSCERGI